MLTYTAMGGSGLGVKRGRSGKRTVWSAAGRRVINPMGGLLPIFRANGGVGGEASVGVGVGRKRAGGGKRRGRQD